MRSLSEIISSFSGLNTQKKLTESRETALLQIEKTGNIYLLSEFSSFALKKNKITGGDIVAIFKKLPVNDHVEDVLQ